jgi:hypothetical protein
MAANDTMARQEMQCRPNAPRREGFLKFPLAARDTFSVPLKLQRSTSRSAAVQEDEVEEDENKAVTRELERKSRQLFAVAKSGLSSSERYTCAVSGCGLPVHLVTVLNKPAFRHCSKPADERPQKRRRRCTSSASSSSPSSPSSSPGVEVVQSVTGEVADEVEHTQDQLDVCVKLREIILVSTMGSFAASRRPPWTRVEKPCCIDGGQGLVPFYPVWQSAHVLVHPPDVAKYSPDIQQCRVTPDIMLISRETPELVVGYGFLVDSDPQSPTAAAKVQHVLDRHQQANPSLFIWAWGCGEKEFQMVLPINSAPCSLCAKQRTVGAAARRAWRQVIMHVLFPIHLAMFTARQQAIRQEEADDQAMLDELDKVEAERAVEAFVSNKTYGPAIGLDAERRLQRSLTIRKRKLLFSPPGETVQEVSEDPILVAVEKALAQFPALRKFTYKW